jgi:energy-coupling factor transport system ATP-binding protein
MVAALLIAAGAVIRLTVPTMFGITPNFAIAMYSLAILLIRPRLGEALGIGIVAGLVCMFSSKAAYPVNLVSETIGAIICYLAMTFFVKINKFTFAPFITTALTTISSGLAFVGVYYVFQLAPVAAMIQMLITVATLTILNSVIVQIIFYPAKIVLKK